MLLPLPPRLCQSPSQYIRHRSVRGILPRGAPITVGARTVTTEDVKRHRDDVFAQGHHVTMIGHKLTVARRVYAAAVAAGLRIDTPAGTVNLRA